MSTHALKRQPAMMMSAAGLVLALVAIMLGPINLVGADVEGGETCSPVSYRALDTRQPAPGTRLGTAATIDVTVAGVGGIPADAKTVKVQLTATRQEGGQAPPGQTLLESFLTVYPKGTPRPNVSNLNPVVGHTSANGAQAVAVGTGGMISVYNNAGQTHVIVDVLEWCDDHTHSAVPVAASTWTADAVDPVVGATGVLLAVTIDVPVAGLIQAVGNTNVLEPGAALFSLCALTLGPGNIATPIDGTARLIVQAGPVGTTCPTNGAVSVAAGTHVINLVGAHLSPTSDFVTSTLDVSFVPGGTLTASGAASSSDGQPLSLDALVPEGFPGLEALDN